MLGLQVKLGQKLNMSQQLQQAIRLLQLSNIELEQEIDQFLESNILLEKAESESDSVDESLEFSVPQEQTDSEKPSDISAEIPDKAENIEKENTGSDEPELADAGKDEELDWEPEYDNDLPSSTSDSE